MANNMNDIPLLTAPFLHYIPTSPPSQELDFHLPSRTPLHGISVSEWAGNKSARHSNDLNAHHINKISTTKSSNVKETSEDSWKDVYRNIKCMDQLYDASFYSWLKSEENVLVTAMYLHRIANEYPLVRIINALKWLISDWRLESISTLVRHVTVDWCDEAGDLRRAHLLRHLTHSWATQYTTTLITMVLSSAPYTNTCSTQKERFLRAFTKDWDFSKLSEFFMYLANPANIDYKVKCVMLQEAARRERETLGAKLRKKRMAMLDEYQDHKTVASSSTAPTIITTADSSSTDSLLSSDATSSSSAPSNTNNSNVDDANRRHHRRTSSNDVNDIKRLRLSTPDLADHSENASESSTAAMRRSVSPDQHHLRTSNNIESCSTSSQHHLRRRSSSNASNESLDDSMDTETITKRKGGASGLSHFTNSSDETI